MQSLPAEHTDVKHEGLPVSELDSNSHQVSARSWRASLQLIALFTIATLLAFLAGRQSLLTREGLLCEFIYLWQRNREC